MSTRPKAPPADLTAAQKAQRTARFIREEVAPRHASINERDAIYAIAYAAALIAYANEERSKPPARPMRDPPPSGDDGVYGHMG